MRRITIKKTATLLIAASTLCCVDTVTIPVNGDIVSLSITVEGSSIITSTLDLNIGEMADLGATADNLLGQTIGEVEANWTSSRPNVVSVASDGLLHALAPTGPGGAALIEATYQGWNATVPVIVHRNPDRVDDLRAVGTTNSSLILRWTQVDDGIGGPAAYALRLGSPTISWGAESASEVIVVGTEVGATLDHTWSGLAEATDYEFQLVAFRGTLNVNVLFGELSNTSSATTGSPPPPPPPNELYPNEPTGMTQVERWDGTSKANPGWATNDKWAENVSVVNDATNPIGTGSVLQMNFAVGENKAGIAVRDAFEGGPYREVYIMYRIFYNREWELIGHKNYYWGAAEASRNNVGSPTQYYITREANGDALAINQNGRSTRFFTTRVAWPGDDGRWVNVEIHAVAESSPGAGDGEMYYWKDGVLMGSSTTAQWVQPDDPISAFDGFEWYAQRNQANTIASWFRVGEVYISVR